jgi:hypothetical protein
MRPPIQDPTAGLTARAIREHPGDPQPIRDPTDPRCEETWPGRDGRAGDPQLILDPTNPDYGKAPARAGTPPSDTPKEV